jgi:hypothetical protein
MYMYFKFVIIHKPLLYNIGKYKIIKTLQTFFGI